MRCGHNVFCDIITFSSANIAKSRFSHTVMLSDKAGATRVVPFVYGEKPFARLAPNPLHLVNDRYFVVAMYLLTTEGVGVK